MAAGMKPMRRAWCMNSLRHNPFASTVSGFRDDAPRGCRPAVVPGALFATRCAMVHRKTYFWLTVACCSMLTI